MINSNFGARRIPHTISQLCLHTAIAISLASLTGCHSLPEKGQAHATQIDRERFLSAIPPERLTTPTRKLAAEGLKALEENRLADASDSFNKALKTDITNPYLNMLNALTYHMRAQQGESQYIELAEEGYKLAIQFDTTNAVFSSQYGQLLFEQRRYSAARDQFARAAMLQPEDRDILYQLAAAAYYSHDPLAAEAALTRLRELHEQDGSSPAEYLELLRMSALNKAALNEPVAARDYFTKYSDNSAEKSKVRQLDARLDKWADTYQAAGKLIKISDSSPALVPSPAFQPSPALLPSTASESSPAIEQTSPAIQTPTPINNAFVDDKMVIVDVVIIGTEEDSGKSMGVNLLKGLQLQFGNPLDQSPGYSRLNSKLVDYITPASSLDTKTVTSLITMPAVSYSLNIANSQSGRNEVLARPTLVARSGQKSEFFSGVEIAAAATSGGNGDAVQVQKEVGVKLSVTPEFAPNGVILLHVTAERTFLTQPSSSVLFTFRLDTSKTIVNAHVAMKLGQTLILSGLSERETEINRDGVPLLQDIPLVQYVFSRNATRNYEKSVIIMLTPRRAQLGYDPYADGDITGGEDSEAVKRLRLRHPLWFPKYSNTQLIFKKLDQDVLFNEFRIGDIGAMPESMEKFREKRLREVVGFLYY